MYINCVLFVALSLALVELVYSADQLEVSTRFGKIRGQYSATRGGKTILEFLGIPFAKPPVGELRFQRLSTRSLLPVIVFIFGGGYLGQSNDKAAYGPELLLDRDVILVTMNYRLGIMGFLTTGDSVVPGNVGMKDQALALKWVADNIAEFGGDPSSVTLMGFSSGAASVHLHMLSPLSQDLFHKAVQHSSSGFVPWAISPPEILRGRANVVAEMVGCPSSPSSALLQCLQRIPADILVNTTQSFLLWDIEPVGIWTPTVEEPAAGAFITEYPRSSSQALTKPLLTGFNNAEGGLKTINVLKGDVAGKFAAWNEQFDTLTPMSLVYNGTDLDCPEVTHAIRKFYFGSDTAAITPDMLKPITEMYGDFWFINGILDYVEMHKGPRYLYYFNHNSSVSFLGGLLNSTLNVGAAHVDEMRYFFPMRGFAPKYDPYDDDYLLSVKLVEMWTNFAKSSNPSVCDVVWEPVKSSALEYLEIFKHNNFTMKSNLLQRRRQFWKTLTQSPICQ